jgi:uncharacterized protein (TIGR03086 family)
MIMDAFAMHRAAVGVWLDRVDHVTEGQWGAATPCAEWDVRQLVEHLVGEQLWTAPLMEGRTIEEVGDRFDGDLLGDDPVGATRRAAKAAVESTPPDGDQGRIVHLSFGDVPAEEYAHQLAADHLVHAWDLAAATGGERELPADLVDAVAAWFSKREGDYRSSGAIGEPVPLPEGARAQDRLLAGFGRDPRWVATSST